MLSRQLVSTGKLMVTISRLCRRASSSFLCVFMWVCILLALKKPKRAKWYVHQEEWPILAHIVVASASVTPLTEQQMMSGWRSSSMLQQHRPPDNWWSRGVILHPLQWCPYISGQYCIWYAQIPDIGKGLSLSQIPPFSLPCIPYKWA